MLDTQKNTRNSSLAHASYARRFAIHLRDFHTTLVATLATNHAACPCSHLASRLTQRLIFLYLLQQRGLFANDTRYLQHRLAQTNDEGGFYRNVLAPFVSGEQLSHDCLAPLGDLFLELEHTKPIPTLLIPNEIFALLFAFLDEYCWCLDNPDEHESTTLGAEVLDILATHENNQKEAGAYYTPTDVTTYITRNTLLPALFTHTRERCQQADSDGHMLARQLTNQPERYLFTAARKGYELSLPAEIAAGCHNPKQREHWQEPGALAYALPGETWREVIARRNHLDEVAAQYDLRDEEMCNRLSTWNLDQHALALDILRTCQQPAFLEAFYHSLRELSVLDPTCGAGAFLCAALAQLEPLHLACLTRMEELLTTPLVQNISPEQRNRWEGYLEEIGKPEQRQATITRRIVEHNLYGVDLMPEAVELCRQRLFLAVLAKHPKQSPRVPTTNVGRQIRVGNSLSGSLEAGPTATSPPDAFHWGQEFPAILLRGGFDVVLGNPPYVEFKRRRQSYSCDGYSTLETGNLYALTIERGLHLLAPGGRFGMIVPASATCTDRYCSLQRLLLAQRELHIASFSDQRGKLFAIPHPRLCIILCAKRDSDETQPCRVFSTPYIKLERARNSKPFERLRYLEVTEHVRPGLIPRYGSPLERSIATKLTDQKHTLGTFLSSAGTHSLYFTRKLSWFVQVTPFIPLIVNAEGQIRAPSELKTLRFASAEDAQIAFVALNSSLFYWFVTTGSDCRNLNIREVLGLPLDLTSVASASRRSLCALAQELEQDLYTHAEMRPMTFQKREHLTIQCIYPARSSRLLDEIDRVLAHHYGLNASELDFLLTYDRKFRVPGTRY